MLKAQYAHGAKQPIDLKLEIKYPYLYSYIFHLLCVFYECTDPDTHCDVQKHKTYIYASTINSETHAHFSVIRYPNSSLIYINNNKMIDMYTKMYIY